MQQPYLGEIRVFAFPLVPQGWAPCDGRSLSKQLYPALAQLLGDAFGATSSTFNLPDLRGRTPIGVQTKTYPMGKSGGAEKAMLNGITGSAAHTHDLRADRGTANCPSPPGAILAVLPKEGQTVERKLYSPVPPSPTSIMGRLSVDSVSSTGGEAHDNMQPSLVLNFCIALTGANPQDSGQE